MNYLRVIGHNLNLIKYFKPFKHSCNDPKNLINYYIVDIRKFSGVIGLNKCNGSTWQDFSVIVRNEAEAFLISRECGHRQCPDLTGNWGLDDSLGDGGHGVPLPEALANTRFGCGELLQLLETTD